MFQPFQRSANVCTVNALIYKRKWGEKKTPKHDNIGHRGSWWFPSTGRWCTGEAWDQHGYLLLQPQETALFKSWSRKQQLYPGHKQAATEASVASIDSAAFTPKIPLQLVGAEWERGTARGKLRSNNEPLEWLKSKCSTSTAYAPWQDRLALFRELGILGVKPPLSVLKIETNPTTMNLNLLQWNKNQNKFFKSQSFSQGKKKYKKWSFYRRRVGEHLRHISGTRGFYSLGF